MAAASANLVSEALQCARTRALFCFLPGRELCRTATCSEKDQKHRKTSAQAVPMSKSMVVRTKSIGNLSFPLMRCTNSGNWSQKSIGTENPSFSRCFFLLSTSKMKMKCFFDVISGKKPALFYTDTLRGFRAQGCASDRHKAPRSSLEAARRGDWRLIGAQPGAGNAAPVAV